MLLSMTGYGTGSAQRNDTTVTVEIRTVNHRFLDLHIRLPREYLFLESDIQRYVRNKVCRGRIEVGLTVQSDNPAEPLINVDLCKSYLEAASKLQDQFKLQESLDLKTLLGLPGVIQNKGAIPGEPAANMLAELTESSMQAALESVLQMRRQEGEVLEAEILCNLASIDEKAKCIHNLSLTNVEEYRRKLTNRLNQLISNSSIDPQRLAQEVALMAEKSDISEEIARLGSHVRQFASLIETGREVGKKLDFLLQEMQREANTLLSKSGNLEITRYGIAIKADIEKLREQVQNVE